MIRYRRIRRGTDPRSRKDIIERDIRGIEAITRVHLRDILRLRKRDVDAIEETRAVDGHLDDLDGGIVTDVHGGVGREGDLRQAEGAGVGSVAGTVDLEDGHHGEGHVGGTAVRAVGAEAEVDVEEGGAVALEPAGLEGEGAAEEGPGCAVAGGAHSSARIHPLHAIRPGIVGDQIVPSLPRVGDDGMCVDEGGEGEHGGDKR